MLEVVLMSAVLGVAQPGTVLPYGRFVATPPTYPPARADDVRRPGFNGKLWVSELFLGGVEHDAVYSGDPGAAAYGATFHEDQAALLRMGHNLVAINPWERQDHPRVEEGRRQWLAERGYTGGVRTFVNDRAALSQAHAAGKAPALIVADATPASDAKRIDPKKIEPRAILEKPADVPSFKSRMRVQHVPAGEPLKVTKAAPVKVVTDAPEAKTAAQEPAKAEPQAKDKVAAKE